jgi:autotransporter strand-loop-strand O-heptosyltransferase
MTHFLAFESIVNGTDSGRCRIVQQSPDLFTMGKSKRKKQFNFRKELPVNICRFSFIDGASIEIIGNVHEFYQVQFIDTANDEVVHQGVIQNNQWIRTARSYFTQWKINIFRKSDNAQVFSHVYDCKDQRVYIALESKALGDTLAWLHSVEEFREKHACQMICSTFMNDLFAEKYPEIEFVEPGVVVSDLYAMYRLGWFYEADGNIDYNKNVRNFREQPLGETASDILGLDYSGIRPRIKAVDLPRPMDQDYVCIAVHSTAQAKYWNNRTGWEKTVRFLNDSGYQVVLLSKEGREHMNNKAPGGIIYIPEGPLEQIINYLKHAKLFIGIGSGLSWLSWAIGCPTCLVSGFSYPYSEMKDCIRIAPDESICCGCFNRYRLDPGDWNWCPDHKNTARAFECTKSITAEQVISALQKAGHALRPNGCNTV